MTDLYSDWLEMAYGGDSTGSRSDVEDQVEASHESPIAPHPGASPNCPDSTSPGAAELLLCIVAVTPTMLSRTESTSSLLSRSLRALVRLCKERLNRSALGGDDGGWQSCQEYQIGVLFFDPFSHPSSSLTAKGNATALDTAVLLPLDTVSPSRHQELKGIVAELANAEDPESSPAVKDFLESVKRLCPTAVSVAGVSGWKEALGKVPLWFTQATKRITGPAAARDEASPSIHMPLRVALFTDDDDPYETRAGKNIPQQLVRAQQCVEEAKALASTGVELEVKTLSKELSESATTPSKGFDADHFWLPLLQQASSFSIESAPSGTAAHEANCPAFSATPLGARGCLLRSSPTPTPLLRTSLRIGIDLSAMGEASAPLSCAAPPICLRVSLYAPIVPATGPRRVRINPATAQPLISRSKYVTLGSTEREVPSEQVKYCTTLGGQRVYFSAEERTRLAGNEATGITVVDFRPYTAVVQREYIIERPLYIQLADLTSSAPAYSRVGSRAYQEEAQSLFVLLNEILREKGLVGIAKYVLRDKAVPRWAALIPAVSRAAADTAAPAEGDDDERSVDPFRDGWTSAQLPVQGVGFYLMALPYMDDIRHLPTDFASAESPPKKKRPREETAVSGNDTPSASPEKSKAAVGFEEAVAMAGDILDALRISYDISAVPNPFLQQQLHALEQAALKLNSPSISPFQQEVLVDYTMPDRLGIQAHAQLLNRFQRRVVCGLEESSNPDKEELVDYSQYYNPEALCKVLPAEKHKKIDKENSNP